MCLKELILTKSMICTSLLFVNISTFVKYFVRFQPKVYDNCLTSIQKAMSFNNIEIFSVNGTY